MHPYELLGLFPPFPRDETVFVAMPFLGFDARWNNVIQPAISEVQFDDKPLKAHRVDLTVKSDSIMAEVVTHIARSRLVLADVSTIGWTRTRFRKVRPVRNGNVLYELGIAHASRLPEEVIVIRSDTDPIDFDLAGVRVHHYDPDERLAAVTTLKHLVTEALKAVDLRRNVAVQRALMSLDLTMYLLLIRGFAIPHPAASTVGDVLAGAEYVAAINRLLAGGMLETKFKTLEPKMVTGFREPLDQLVSYGITRFGNEVLIAAREKIGYFKAVGEWTETPDGKKWIESMVEKARSTANRTE